MNSQPFCFFMMPFREELNFLFLYLQKHLTETHRLHVERGDHKVLTQPLMEKILRQITQCDFAIADVTGGNPNVFYELGIAHTLKKPVIFLTQDSPKDAPVDIRPYEFIVYSLGNHTELLSKLDNAVSALFTERHRDVYQAAQEALAEFNTEMGSQYSGVTEADFLSRLMRSGGADAIRALSDEAQRKRSLLAKIVKDTSEVAVMERITSWHKEG